MQGADLYHDTDLYKDGGYNDHFTSQQTFNQAIQSINNHQTPSSLSSSTDLKPNHPPTTMKFTTILATTFALAASSSAYVVEMYPDPDCGGSPTERNVWDNSCAYVDGFQSFKMTTHGGGLQQMTAYSRQACAGTTTFQGCAAGVNAVALNECINTSGGTNALSSYSSGGPCPN